jgi:hypothetical protein
LDFLIEDDEEYSSNLTVQNKQSDILLKHQSETTKKYGGSAFVLLLGQYVI